MRMFFLLMFCSKRDLKYEINKLFTRFMHSLIEIHFNYLMKWKHFKNVYVPFSTHKKSLHVNDFVMWHRMCVRM